jgi:hypothetical protein
MGAPRISRTTKERNLFSIYLLLQCSVVPNMWYLKFWIYLSFNTYEHERSAIFEVISTKFNIFGISISEE